MFKNYLQAITMKLALIIVIGPTLLAPFNAYAGLFGPDNYFECALANLPGASNDTVAYQMAAQCSSRFPADAQVKKKTGFLAAYNSGAECTIKKAKETQSQLAARIIQASCFALYEPLHFDPSLLMQPPK